MGRQALQEAEALQPREKDYLAHFTRLERIYPSEIARTALEIAILRLEASSKFPFAGKLYLTREAMEQASPYEVSSYRAERFRGFRFLADLGCSIGGDTIVMARLAPTVGIDRDPLRLALARANLVSLGLEGKSMLVQAELADYLPLESSRDIALFFDPSRRKDERRAYSVHDYNPPLGVVHRWLERFQALGVKISPGVNLEELTSFPAEVEFISLHGDLKEAALWFGPLRTTARRATVLPGPYTIEAPDRLPELPLDEPRSYLYEPDPSVLRAGLVEELGARLNAAQVDPDIAYLTSDRLVHTPFARVWPVEAWFPFQLKRLRAALRERGVGQVVVKKRGSPLQPEALIRDLKLKGDNERVVFLTHLRGRPIVILAHGEIDPP